MKNKTNKKGGFKIPFSEINFKYSKSSGPGGQNVNKLNTKVFAKWNFMNSSALDGRQKAFMSEKLKNWQSAREGEITVYCQKTRFLKKNKEIAEAELNKLANKALWIKPKRKLSKPSKEAKERRLSGKKIISEKKKRRKKDSRYSR